MTITRIGKAHWIERGERIERARDWVGMTQEDLAAALAKHLKRSYSRTIISNIELGHRKVTVDELRVIAYLVDQTEEWLDCGDEAVFNESAINRVSVLGLLTHRPLLAAA